MRTLVLNAGYEPLAVVSYKRALILVLNEKANLIAADESAPVRSMTESWPRPSVIILRNYVRIPGRQASVSRRGVLRRAAQRCGYCGAHATTIDHVLPRSRGGQDTWENLVACCQRCNNLKGDRTPAELGWKLRSRPKAPHGPLWLVRGVERAEPDWGEYLGTPVAA